MHPGHGRPSRKDTDSPTCRYPTCARSVQLYHWQALSSPFHNTYVATFMAWQCYESITACALITGRVRVCQGSPTAHQFPMCSSWRSGGFCTSASVRVCLTRPRTIEHHTPSPEAPIAKNIRHTTRPQSWGNHVTQCACAIRHGPSPLGRA